MALAMKDVTREQHKSDDHVDHRGFFRTRHKIQSEMNRAHYGCKKRNPFKKMIAFSFCEIFYLFFGGGFFHIVYFDAR